MSPRIAPKTSPAIDTRPKGPTTLLPAPKPQPPSILNPVRLQRDEFIEDMQRRSAARPTKQLQLPADATKSVTASSVPIPPVGAQPSVREAFVANAIQQLGFSPQVAAIATTELAKRLGKDLVIDLGSGAPLSTRDDIVGASGNDTQGPYTFTASSVAVLKDANLAASLGLNSLDELYAKQAGVVTRLQQAAMNGTDVDLEAELSLINDPTTRDVLERYYETTRTTRDLGLGDERAFDKLSEQRAYLAQAMAKLPKGGPLNKQLEDLSRQLDAAQTTLLAGTGSSGKTPRAAVALLNNIANAPLGLPTDDAEVEAAITRIETAAQQAGATDEQSNALGESLRLAWGLKQHGGSTPERLAANKAKLAEQVRAAGPYAAPLQRQFAAISAGAHLKPTAESVLRDVDPEEAKSGAEVVSSLAGQLKLMAKSKGVPGLGDALEALESAADRIKNGETAEGILAGLKAAPAVIASLVELGEKLPELKEQAAALMKKMSVVFKGPVDLFGAYANAKKVMTGKDLDGKPVTQGERANAAADLVLSDLPGLASGAATLAGATTVGEVLSAAAPPLAFLLLEVKLGIATLEEVAKMKSNIAQYMLRDRFDLGDGTNFDKQLTQQLNALSAVPVTRADQAVTVMKGLLNEQFKDSDTRMRFIAFCSAKMGRQTVDALLNGRRVPAFIDAEDASGRKEGAKTIAAAGQMRRLAAEFYRKEFAEVRSSLDNQFRGNSGESYMTSPEERRELAHRFPQRPTVGRVIDYR